MTPAPMTDTEAKARGWFCFGRYEFVSKCPMAFDTCERAHICNCAPEQIAAIAREARNHALDEAAEVANRLHGAALFKWQTRHGSQYDAGYDDAARKQASLASTAILALKDTPPNA